MQDNPDLDQLVICPNCKTFMPYVGITYAKVAVCVQKYDMDGDPYTVDERVNAPYATWKCPTCGHKVTDGY